jgi:hypothetical protein
MRLLGLFLFIHTVAGWSSEGHKIASRIALGLMKKKTRRFLREHLEEIGLKKAVSLASSWADVISGDRPETSSFHFVNVEYRKCSSDSISLARPFGESRGPCIVSAIANFAQTASNISLPFEDRQEAIKFLLHLVADAHQPLHAGFDRDRGGTLINLERPEDKSLHEVWDDTLVDMLTEFDGMKWYDVARSLGELKDTLERFKLASVGDDWIETAVHIVSETVSEHTCASAYRNETEGWIGSGDSLSAIYLKSRSAIAKEQLLKSAARLAQIMDAVASKFVAAERKQQASLLAPKSEVAAADENKFSALFLDVDDIEEFGFELPEESEDEDEAVEVPTEVLTTPTPTTTGEPVSAEEKKRLAYVKKRKKAKANKRKIDGVDVESLVLIKRRGRFFVTVKDLVVSESFTPVRYFVIYVRFRGMLETEAAIPFLIDGSIFGGQKARIPTKELIDAIFRHISGTERAKGGTQTTNAPAESVESDKVVGGRSSNAYVGFSAIADYVKLIKPPKEALRERYGGEVPSCARLAIDALKAKGDQVVDTINLIPGVRVVTTKDVLLNSDSGERRIVFLQDSAAPVESLVVTRLWVDLRVIDGSDCVDDAFWAEVTRISVRAQNTRNLREVINKGSRLLDRLFVLYSETTWAALQQKAAFEVQRAVGKDREYRELVLRDSETERRLLQIFGAPPIGHCLAPGTRVYSRKAPDS